MSLPHDAVPVRYYLKPKRLAFTSMATPVVKSEYLGQQGNNRVPPGRGVIRGVVTVEGEPAVQLLRAHRRHDGKMVGQATSFADGSYAIPGLEPGEAYYILALDRDLRFNAVVADNVIALEA